MRFDRPSGAYRYAQLRTCGCNIGSNLTNLWLLLHPAEGCSEESLAVDSPTVLSFMKHSSLRRLCEWLTLLASEIHFLLLVMQAVEGYWLVESTGHPPLRRRRSSIGSTLKLAWILPPSLSTVSSSEACRVYSSSGEAAAYPQQTYDCS